MKKLRVIQWTTGKVGQFSLRAILDDPRLELAGVYAFSADKTGQDAGTLCGRSPCGIRATSNIDELIALKADTVLYTPFLAELDDVIRLLESGLDVISTNLFVNLGGVQGEVKRQLELACEKGSSSLYITGVHPGWANSMVTALTGGCRRVESVTLLESADCSTYQSAETWQALGFSLPEATDQVIDIARGSLLSFADSTQAMADAMEFKLDERRFFVEFAKAAETVDLGWFSMEKGTIAAIRGGWEGIVNDRVVVRTGVAWYLTDKLDQGWTFNDDHYQVEIVGDPGVKCLIQFVSSDYWGPEESLISTALPAVNTIFNVKAAAPGILSIRDVGLPVAPAGLWPGN